MFHKESPSEKMFIFQILIPIAPLRFQFRLSDFYRISRNSARWETLSFQIPLFPSTIQSRKSRVWHKSVPSPTAAHHLIYIVGEIGSKLVTFYLRESFHGIVPRSISKSNNHTFPPHLETSPFPAVSSRGADTGVSPSIFQMVGDAWTSPRDP